MRIEDRKAPLLSRRGFVAGGAAACALAALGAAGCAPAAEEAEEQPEALDRLTAALASPLPPLGAVPVAEPGALSVARHAAEGLYDLDPRTFKAYAALADGAPQPADEGAYEVALRAGASFSDGTPVSAADVVEAFERARGAGEAYAALLAPIAALAAIDATTVRVELAHPLPTLLERRLALAPVAKPAEAPGGAVGSGPWAIEAVDEAAGSISFAPNACYEGERAAQCEAMAWSFSPDGATRAQRLLDGEALAADGMAGQDVEGVDPTGCTVEYVPGYASPFLMFDCEREPFSDVRVRQALLFAVDYDLLVSDLLGGHASVPTGVLPVQHEGYVRAEVPYSHDVERARKLLAAAAATPLELRLVLQDAALAPIAERIAQDWAQLGVSAQVEAVGAEGLPAALEPGFDVALCYDDPTLLGHDVDLILTWRYGGAVAPERFCRWAGEGAERARALMQQARESADEAEQQRLWAACFATIEQEVPLHPLAFLKPGTAWRADALKGFEPLSIDGIDFLGVSLREEV